MQILHVDIYTSVCISTPSRRKVLLSTTEYSGSNVIQKSNPMGQYWAKPENVVGVLVYTKHVLVNEHTQSTQFMTCEDVTNIIINHVGHGPCKNGFFLNKQRITEKWLAHH